MQGENNRICRGSVIIIDTVITSAHGIIVPGCVI